jgi:photosynthetic reaction center cytochrome c subunit
MRACALLLLLCPIGVYAQRGAPQAPPPTGPPKNLKILPPGTNVLQVMGGVRVALGVQCNFCHNPADYPSDEKPQKLMARNMFRMMDDLNSGPLNGKMHVTCYTCHRGESTPRMEPAPPGAARGGGRGGRGGRGAPPADDNN